MPKPSCKRERKVLMDSMRTFPATFATNRRREQPTAIGPSFFSRATSNVPKKKGQTSGGVTPLITILTKEMRAFRNSKPPSSAEAATKCINQNLLYVLHLYSLPFQAFPRPSQPKTIGSRFGFRGFVNTGK